MGPKPNKKTKVTPRRRRPSGRKRKPVRILPDVLVPEPEKLSTKALRNEAERLITVVYKGHEPHASHARKTLETIKNVILKRGTAAVREFGNQAYFKWPNIYEHTEPPSVRQESDLREKGILGFIKYRVGNGGQSPVVRRKLLDWAFMELRLPDDDLEEFPEIGLANSSTRLRAIAYAIAYQIRTKRKSFKDYSAAIEDWSDDLCYLKERHYDGRFSFGWPSLPPSKSRLDEMKVHKAHLTR